jgi:hypothetical protein
MTFRPAIFDREILPRDITGLAQSLANGIDKLAEIARRGAVQKSDHRHRGMLRACGQRPCRRRATEQRNKLPPLHSITSSAIASSVQGTWSALQHRRISKLCAFRVMFTHLLRYSRLSRQIAINRTDRESQLAGLQNFRFGCQSRQFGDVRVVQFTPESRHSS